MPWYMENREHYPKPEDSGRTKVWVMASLSATHPGIQFPGESFTLLEISTNHLKGDSHS